MFREDNDEMGESQLRPSITSSVTLPDDSLLQIFLMNRDPGRFMEVHVKNLVFRLNGLNGLSDAHQRQQNGGRTNR